MAHIYEDRGEIGEKPNYSRAHTLAGHMGNLSGLAFHPQGTLLATSGFDGTARLWDLDEGAEILILASEDAPIAGVDFSPDGRHLVAAGADGKLSVYVVPIDDLMDVARARLSRDFTYYECRRYLHQNSCTFEE